MDVSSIGPTAEPVRFSAAEYASNIAEVNKEARLDKPLSAPGEATTNAANVVSSKSYSPAIVAAAAHYQVLAQAGAFAALQANQSATTAPSSSRAPAVTKVDSVAGSSVDNVA